MIVVFSTFVQYSVISFRNLFLEENNLTKQIAQGHLDGIHCLPILIGRVLYVEGRLNHIFQKVIDLKYYSEVWLIYPQKL